jgi:hypothetical protein
MRGSVEDWATRRLIWQHFFETEERKKERNGGVQERHVAIGRLACREWTEPWSGSRARWTGYKKSEVCRKWPSYCELMHIHAFGVGDRSEHVLAWPRAGLITTYQDLTRLAIGQMCMNK